MTSDKNTTIDNNIIQLFAAIKANDVATVRQLLLNGVTANWVNDEGASPLLAACMYGNSEIVELLLFWGADGNEKSSNLNGMTPLIVATVYGHPSIINLLLNSILNIEIDVRCTSDTQAGATALTMAIANNDRSTVKTLLKHGANANLQYDIEAGGSSLNLAVASGFKEIVEELLDGGASIDIEVDSYTALLVATQRGCEDIVELLLQRKANPNHQAKSGITAMMEAAEKGHMSIVQTLLSFAADPNLRREDGNTALTIAVFYEYTDIVHLLLEGGAVPNICACSGWSPLIYAAQGGYTHIAKLLLAKNAPPNIQALEGHTALMLAAQNGHYGVAELLLVHHADPNIKQFVDSTRRENPSIRMSGMTAMMFATQRGHTKIVELLLKYKADPAIRSTITNNTAFAMAKQFKKTDIIALLEPLDFWTGVGKLANKSANGISRLAKGVVLELNSLPASESNRLLEAKSAPSTNTRTIDQDAELKQALDELDSFVGLENVKVDVAKHINLLRVQQMRREKGLSVPEQSLHMAFSGNPGTGKTSVARLIAKIYKQMGILSKGQFVETDRTGLVAEYIGQTAPKVQAVVKKAIGGVLFIDEAYTLSGSERGSDQFGQEAIDTLLKLMEDHRNDLIVIVAGYTEPMQRFIESNPGLQSRFNKYLHFEDYSPDDLTSIFSRLAKQHDYELTATAQAKVTAVFQQAYQNRSRTFGNARLSRNLFEKAISEHAMRIGSLPDVTESDLVTIAAEDIQL